MLKTLVNEAYLRLNIITKGPLLIKSGYTTVIGADMAPVKTYRNGRQELYLPGSSLKGVFRSHSEKVINSLKPHVACNPLSQDEARGSLYRPSCGSQMSDKDIPSHVVYARSCPSCRLFGSTSFIGRIAIDDACLPEGSAGSQSLIEHRDGIAIDRLTGGVSGNAKFDLEVVTVGTTFHTSIRLRNFEIWQLGLLFVILQDMDDELIRIGSGRSRGLGKIKATINEQAEGTHPGGVVLSTIRATKQQEPDQAVWGLGRWLEDETSYDTRRDDLLTLAQPLAHTARGVRLTRAFKGEQLQDLREQSIEAFVMRMQQWPDAPQMPTSNGARQRGK